MAMVITKTQTIKDRLKVMIAELLKDSAIPGAYRPVIENLILGFLKSTDEAKIKEMLIDLQEKVLPWVING